MAIMSGFQPEDGGSIPPTRSIKMKVPPRVVLLSFTAGLEGENGLEVR